MLFRSVAEGGQVQAVNLVGAEDYLLSLVSLCPAAEQKTRAIELRRQLMQQPEGSQLSMRYIGLSEKADAAARAAIDETWGMLE